MLNNEVAEIFYFRGKEIHIIYGDITLVQSDVIVSSDDNHLTMGGGVSQAIHFAGGEIIREESRKFIPAKLGDVLLTSAGELKAKYIFHAIVIDFDNDRWPNVELIAKVVKNCLQEANKLTCQSIAFPAFGTGAGQLASQSVAVALINTLFNELENTKSIQKILLVLNRRGLLYDFVKMSVEARVRTEYELKLNMLRQEKESLLSELQAKNPYQQLPIPISIPRQLIESYTSYHSKFTSTVECAEAILKYCSCIVFAEYLRLYPSQAKQEFFKLFETPVTFGGWQKHLEIILQSLKNAPSTFSIIPLIDKAYFSKNRGLFSQIIKERNEKYGHGATLTDTAYKPIQEKLVTSIDSILQSFNFLKDYPLIVISQTDITDEGFQYDVIRLMGDNLIFKNESIFVKSLRLPKEKLYILDVKNEAALSLNPFLVFEICPHCHIQETFFLEKNNTKESSYHTYRANHRMTSDKYAGLLLP